MIRQLVLKGVILIFHNVINNCITFTETPETCKIQIIVLHRRIAIESYLSLST